MGIKKVEQEIIQLSPYQKDRLSKDPGYTLACTVYLLLELLEETKLAKHEGILQMSAKAVEGYFDAFKAHEDELQ